MIILSTWMILWKWLNFSGNPPIIPKKDPEKKLRKSA